jgi:hypothetical protein
MKFSSIVYVFLVTIFLVGCGGGSSPVSLDQSADGVWKGHRTVDQPPWPEIVSIFYGGKYVTISDKKFYVGSYTVVDDKISSQDTKSFYWDGSYIATGSLEGDVYSNSFILSTYREIIDTDTGEEKIYHDNSIYSFADSERKLTSGKLKGTWVSVDPDIGYLSAIAIERDSFNAQSSDGCFIEGKLNIPVSSLNVFELSLVISGETCAYNGDYSGLGYLKEDEITFAYSNDDYGFVFDAVRFGSLGL